MKPIKHSLCLLTAFILSAAVLSGCGSDTNTENEGMGPADGNMPAMGETLEGDMPAGEFGGTPPEGVTAERGNGNHLEETEETLSEKQTQIRGQVTSIIGNEVILKLSGNTSAGKSGNQERSAETLEKKQSDGQENFDGDSSPSDTVSHELFASSSAASSEGVSEIPEESSETTASRETKTLLIPVGLTLSGGAESSARSKDFSSISEGMSLIVTLENANSENEKVVAVRITSNG